MFCRAELFLDASKNFSEAIEKNKKNWKQKTAEEKENNDRYYYHSIIMMAWNIQNNVQDTFKESPGCKTS